MKLPVKTWSSLVGLVGLISACVKPQVAPLADAALPPPSTASGRYADRTPPPRSLFHLPAPPVRSREITDVEVRNLMSRVSTTDLLKFEMTGTLFRLYRDTCHSFPCRPFEMTVAQQDQMKFAIAASVYEDDSNRKILAELSAMAVKLAPRMDVELLAGVLLQIDQKNLALDGNQQLRHDVELMLYGPPGR